MTKGTASTAGTRVIFQFFSGTASPVDDFGTINVTGAKPTHDQFMRVRVETVVSDGVAANRMKRLGAHLAKLAFGDIEEVGSARDVVQVELGRVLGGIVGDDQTVIGDIDTTLEWQRLQRDGAAHRKSPL